MIAILKPCTPSELKLFINDADRRRCSKHRPILILDDSDEKVWEVEEIKTGLRYPCLRSRIMPVKSLSKEQAAEVAA